MGEQLLPNFGSCNLGSINIANDCFYNKDGSFNYEELAATSDRIGQFLDNVGTVNVFPSPKFRQWYEDNRPVGAGIMGLHDAMLRRGILYQSSEGIEFTESIMRCLAESAHKTSVRLGKERGTPKSCNFEELEFRRNVTTTSIAPTGSISFIGNCSSSIEPVFSPETYRTDERGEVYTLSHPYRNESFFTATIGVDNAPSPEDHVIMQAKIQEYVDAGVSKTVNLPESATIEDVYNIYHLAWKMQCKGITVYRNNSREFQVLNDKKTADSNGGIKNFSTTSLPIIPLEVKDNPGCDGDCDIVKESGCKSCKACGWSACSIA